MEINTQALVISNLFTLAIFLGGGAGFFLSTLLKGNHKQQGHDSVNEHQQMVEQAQQQAHHMLDGSVATSAHIIQTAKQTNEHVMENLDHILQTIAQKHIEILRTDSEHFKFEFEKQLKIINGQFDQNAQNITQATQNTIALNMQQFTQNLVTKASQSEGIIDKKLQELLTQVEFEIAEYKKTRMEKLDQRIEQLVEKTYQKVLRRSIPETLHKELILDSLEKAKTEGVLAL